MVEKKTDYGLLIHYEYCTGCYTCMIACSQEHNWPAGMAGMKVMEVMQDLPKDKAYLSYIPFPTELCVLCAGRVKKGLKPACVQHCMANCISHGTIEELAKEMKGKKRTVLWNPN